MKLSKLFFMAIIAVSLSACGGDEPAPPVVVPNGTYVGTLSVGQNNGTVFTQENVSVVFEISKDNVVKLVMQQIKFSERMPLTLDMTIDSIAATAASDAEGYVLLGNNIVPTAMGGPYPDRTITELVGNVTDKTLSVSMKGGGAPLTFTGKKE
jgi:hypothetical protein